MDRRRFIELTAGFSSLLFASSTEAKIKIEKRGQLLQTADDIILDQSGTFGTGFFTAGALFCRDPSAANDHIDKLRAESSFRCKLSHSSRNKYKMPYAKSLIDYWIDVSEIKIDLITMDSKGKKNEKPIVKWSRYLEVISRLIDISAKDINGKCRLLTQRHFSPDRQFEFEQTLMDRNKKIGSIIKIDEDSSDLMQLLDLMAGSARADYDRESVKNRTKKQLMDYILQKLGTQSLTGPVNQNKFSITSL